MSAFGPNTTSLGMLGLKPIALIQDRTGLDWILANYSSEKCFTVHDDCKTSMPYKRMDIKPGLCSGHVGHRNMTTQTVPFFLAFRFAVEATMTPRVRRASAQSVCSIFACSPSLLCLSAISTLISSFRASPSSLNTHRTRKWRFSTTSTTSLRCQIAHFPSIYSNERGKIN
jgi:hypothetical protein